MKITEITIKNFRSIVNQTIIVSNMNIFVGTNDVGKSNVLKALNLFFNNETEVGTNYNFDTDFTYLFNKKSKEAKEITIRLVFEAPSSYKGEGEIVWEKKWRMDGLRSDKEKMYIRKPKAEISSRSRIPSALRGIKYRYVPAVKSDAFFKELLGTLYDTMSLSLGESIQKPMNEFSRTLQNATLSLSNDVNQALNLESVLTVPTDLRELFTTLNFDTQTDAKITYSLDYRGDGIKTRHIPIILKYIAEQDMKTRNQGSTQIFTFWGYEEPENSLEMMKSFELANQLQNYSEEIQMFITTHSPAFYLCGENEKVSLLHVKQEEYDKDTTIQPVCDINEVNNDIGLLQLVSPFIKIVSDKTENISNEYKKRIESLTRVISEKGDEIQKLKELIDNTGIIDIPTIFVEGKTDRIYLEEAIKRYNSTLETMLCEQRLKIYSNDEYGGVKSVKEWTHAWCLTKNQSKMIAMFDSDSAANIKKKEIQEDEIFQERISKWHTLKLLTIPKTSTIIDMYKKGIKFEYSIEHLFTVDIWKKCKSYLENKKNGELPALNDNVADPEKGKLPQIRELIGCDVTDSYLSIKIKKDKKMNFCNKILNLSKNDDTIFSEFKPLVDEIADYFCVVSDDEQ